MRLSLCIVHSNSFNICAPGTSVPTAEDDDEELVFAASQCEAQLNTGVAYDTNAHIKKNVLWKHTEKHYQHF